MLRFLSKFVYRVSGIHILESFSFFVKIKIISRLTLKCKRLATPKILVKKNQKTYMDGLTFPDGTFLKLQ